MGRNVPVPSLAERVSIAGINVRISCARVTVLGISVLWRFPRFALQCGI